MTQGKETLLGPRIGIRAAAAIGALTLMATGCASSDEKNPVDTFTNAFTAKNGCLDNTPYDPDKGALIHADKIDGTEEISVVPRAANTYEPSVLFFSVGEDGSLTFGDHYTGSFMSRMQCPDQPNGY